MDVKNKRRNKRNGNQSGGEVRHGNPIWRSPRRAAQEEYINKEHQRKQRKAIEKEDNNRKKPRKRKRYKNEQRNEWGGEEDTKQEKNKEAIKERKRKAE